MEIKFGLCRNDIDCVIGNKTYHAKIEKWIVKTNINFYFKTNGVTLPASFYIISV